MPHSMPLCPAYQGFQVRAGTGGLQGHPGSKLPLGLRVLSQLEHLAKFVPDVVRKRIDENPEAPQLAKREQTVSVLFIDLVGYTTLSQSMSPADLSALIERYFSAFLDLIADSGGDINETAGDGFMAIFDAPEPAMAAAAAA